MRSSVLSLGIVGLAVSALAPAALAVNFNESSFPGGDFNSSFVIGGQPTVITTPLGLGSNTITGRASNAGGLQDNDYFRVTLPAGTTIDLVSIAISNFALPPGVFFGIGSFNLFSPNTGAQQLFTNGSFNVPVNITDPSNVRFIVTGPQSQPAGSFDYVLSLNVVPAPSAAALLGLGGLLATRRRRA